MLFSITINFDIDIFEIIERDDLDFISDILEEEIHRFVFDIIKIEDYGQTQLAYSRDRDAIKFSLILPEDFKNVDHLRYQKEKIAYLFGLKKDGYPEIYYTIVKVLPEGLVDEIKNYSVSVDLNTHLIEEEEESKEQVGFDPLKLKVNDPVMNFRKYY